MAWVSSASATTKSPGCWKTFRPVKSTFNSHVPVFIPENLFRNDFHDPTGGANEKRLPNDCPTRWSQADEQKRLWKWKRNATFQGEWKCCHWRWGKTKMNSFQPIIFNFKRTTILARRYYTRRHRVDQCASWFVLRHQRQRAGWPGVGSGRQQNELDGFRRGHRQLGSWGFRVHRRLHHRPLGCNHWRKARQNKAMRTGNKSRRASCK